LAIATIDSAWPARQQRNAARRVALCLVDGALRADLAAELRSLRWGVSEAVSGAGLFALLDGEPFSAVILGGWLPDFAADECVQELQDCFPGLAIVCPDGMGTEDDAQSGPRCGSESSCGSDPGSNFRSPVADGSDCPRPAAPRVVRGLQSDALRQELLYALRRVERRRSQAPDSSWRETDPGADPGASANRVPESAPNCDAARRRASDRVLDRVLDRAPDAAVDPVHPGAFVLSLSAAGAGLRPAAGTAMPRRGAPARGPAAVHASLPEFLGADAPLLEVARKIRLVAARRTPVLIHGASGTGKELVARAIHRLSGRGEGRAAARFVAINCAAIPEALVESELFGHARGAFTGAVNARAGRIEAASGGTIFLDEVGELPPAVQSKLLRFLESGEMQRVGESETVRVDARVVAATHRKLGAMVAEGSFRLDLLHRLAVFLIETPALAGRTEVIDSLIEHRLAALALDDPALPLTVRRLSEEARARLHAHPWPGNVRELEHTLERAVILAGDALIVSADCIDFGEALY
jgi:hypothetical protein